MPRYNSDQHGFAERRFDQSDRNLSPVEGQQPLEVMNAMEAIEV